MKVRLLTGLWAYALFALGGNALWAQQYAPKWQLGIKGWTELATSYQLQEGELDMQVQPRLALGAGLLMRRWIHPHVGIEMGGSAISRGYRTDYPILDAAGQVDSMMGKRMEQWWQVPVGLCFRAGAWYAAVGPFAEVYRDGHWRIRSETGVERRIPLTQEELSHEVSFGAWFGTGFTFQLSRQLGLLTSLRAHVTDPIPLPGSGAGLSGSLYTGNVNGGVNVGLLYQL